MNQSIEEYLRIFVNYLQDNWTEWLSLAEFTYNDREHSATKQTPFFLNHGHHPWKGFEPTRTTNVESAEQFAQRLKHAREEAQSACKRSVFPDRIYILLLCNYYLYQLYLIISRTRDIITFICIR